MNAPAEADQSILHLARKLHQIVGATIFASCILPPIAARCGETQQINSLDIGMSSQSEIFSEFEEVCLVGRSIENIDTSFGRCATGGTSGIYGVTTDRCYMLFESKEFPNLQVEFEYDHECRSTKSSWRIDVRDRVDPELDSLVFFPQ